MLFIRRRAETEIDPLDYDIVIGAGAKIVYTVFRT
jgi:hypothetical protein